MKIRPAILCVLLLVALPLLLVLSSAWGETGWLSPANFFADDDAGPGALIVSLRVYRALCAIAVGGSLALGGGLAQGLFRNPLAEPGLLGVSGGAALGAMLGVALLGGYGVDLFNWFGSGANMQADLIARAGILVIPLLAMIGAFGAALFVYRWSLRQGKVAVSSLLLAGLALNSIAGALMTGLQTLLLDDFHVTRAIVSWGFGALNDRGPVHAAIAWIGVCCALPAIPGLGLELDLLSGGEQDAESMGANVTRVKTLALIAIALCTATAVAVSGQIAFVGLLVPHLVRRLSGPRHRWLLLNSFLLGGTVLLGAVVFQNGFCPWLAGQLSASGWLRLAALSRRVVSLQPGVLTSLFGAPFFLYVLLKQTSLGAHA